MRLMKCSILVMNNLNIGLNLLQYILNETDSILVKGKDGQTQMNLTWKSLIGFECLAIAFNNPYLIKAFSVNALQVGKPVLIHTHFIQILLQMFESLAQASENLDLSGELNVKHMQNPHFSHQKSQKFIEAQSIENELNAPQPIQIHKLISKILYL